MVDPAWPNAELSRCVRAGGIRWHVQRGGSGPVMLLLHGTGAATHSWRGLLPLLTPHFSVIAPDLPGHGFTDSVAAAGSSIGGMSAGIAALLDELGARPDYCVGHSAGAVISCRLVLDGRVAPRRIVSLNGAFLPLAGQAGVLFAPMARLLSAVSLVPRLFAWSAGNRANVERLIESTGSHLDAAGVELYARLVRDPRHVAGALQMMGNWDLYGFERQLPRLAAPLELLVGGNDRTVPPRQAEIVKTRVPHAAIHRLSGLGHLAHEEDPQTVAATIVALCPA